MKDPLLEAVVANCSEAVTVVDTKGQFVHANAEAAALLGFDSVEALLGAHPREVRDRYQVVDEQLAPLPMEKLPVAMARGLRAGGAG